MTDSKKKQMSYIATVQLLIVVDEDETPEDAVTGLLSTAICDENSGILDWSYLKFGAQYLYPVHYRYLDIEQYDPGDVFP